MKSSIRQRLDSLKERFEEVGLLLSSPEIINNTNKFRDLSKEYAELEKITAPYQAYLDNENAQKNAELLMKDSDLEMRELAEEELKELKKSHDELDQHLQILLLPKDPNDQLNIFLKYVLEPAVMKQLFLPEIYFECTATLLNLSVGKLKSFMLAMVNMVAIKKLLPVYLGKMYIHTLNLNQVLIVFNVFLKQNRKVEFTPQLAPLLSCLNRKRLIPLISIQMTLKLIPLELLEPVASTSIKPILQSELRIFQQVLLLNAKMSDLNIKSRAGDVLIKSSITGC